jgi:hypothetical protein
VYYYQSTRRFTEIKTTIAMSDKDDNRLTWETFAKVIAAIAALITAVVTVYKLFYDDKGKVTLSLPVQVSYLYRSAGQSELRTLAPGSELRSGDHYKIWFTPEKDGYVYIFQIDSSQAIHRLFPLESFQGVAVNQSNPVRAGREYHLPAENKAFELDDQTGQEKIYVLTFQQPNTALERLYDALEQARQQQNTTRIADLQMSLLNELQKSVSAAIPALTFVHLERRGEQ